MTQAQISYILAGTQYPSIETLEKLSVVTGITVEVLAYADTETRLKKWRERKHG